MEILPLFCDIDDFCLLFEPLWERKLLETRRRRRASALWLSEVMTIITLFHASSYRNFKAYYTEQVLKRYVWAFPRLVSYGRFVELKTYGYACPDHAPRYPVSGGSSSS